MDFGTAIKFAFDDKDWWKKCLIVGLYTFIPVLGFIAAFGWQRRVFDQIRAGRPTPLPEINFGEDLKHGITPFVAMMNMGILVFALWFVMFAVGMVAGIINDRLGGIVMGLGGMLVGLCAMAAGLLVPDFLRRAYVDDEKFPLLKIGPTLKAVTGDLGSFFMLYIGLLVGNFLGGIGGVACGIGTIVTTPWGMAIGAHFIAQYQTRIEAKNAGTGWNT